MMKKTLLLTLFVLTGCVSVGGYQAKCEQQYPKMSDMVMCLDKEVNNDWRLSSLPVAKLYVLKAKSLVENVNEKKISETDARLELQNLYVNLKRQETADLQQGLLNYQVVNTLQSIEEKNKKPQLKSMNTSTQCSSALGNVMCNSQSHLY